MAQITLNSSGVASDGALALQSNGTTTAVTITTAQNVGIGTSSPAYKLDVVVASNKRVVAFTPTSSSGISDFSNGGVGWNFSRPDDGVFRSSIFSYNTAADAKNNFAIQARADMVFATGGDFSNSTERMRIDSSGNVGIGTSSPSFISGYGGLQINGGGNGSVVHLTNSTTGTTSTDGFDLILSQGSSDVYVWQRENAPLIFGTNATERARIDSSGNLLVGGTTAAARMYVVGAGTTNATVALRVQDSATTDMFYVRNDGLIVTGSKSASPYNNTTGSAANMFVDSVGSLYRSTSSLKYKKNVQNAAHGLNQLLTLRPVTYEGKAESDAGKTFGGLIAEEVHEAGLTEFVQYAEDGSPDALAYGNMVSLCVKAIQEQQAIITSLTDRITALEAK